MFLDELDLILFELKLRVPSISIFLMISSLLKRNMSQSNISKVRLLAQKSDEKIVEIKKWVENLKKVKVEEKIKQLTEENTILTSQVEAAKNELIKLENANGKKQYPIPNKPAVQASLVEIPQSEAPLQTPVVKKEKKEKEAKKGKEPSKKANEPVNDIIDVRKLDLRVGKIVEVNKHPDADTLYVEKIDCGEEKPRTVVSGLVNHVPIEQMQDRIVMVLCNLKPVKMRGVTSEAMVMCASSPDKVEVLIPPASAVPGDLVSCEGYPREPEPILNPKKKIFETCAPDLLTNKDKVACYKGNPLIVPGKGSVTAPTLKEVNVK